MRRTAVSAITLLIAVGLILTACATQSPTPPMPTIAAGSAATTAGATSSSSAAAPTVQTAGTATPVADAGATIKMPPNLRIDLKNTAITAILAGPNIAWDRLAASEFTKATGIAVTVIQGDDNATELLADYVKRLNDRPTLDVDVFQIDVIWPGILAPFAEDLSQEFATLQDDFIKDTFLNGAVEKQQVAIPWFTDVGLLYYREDLRRTYQHLLERYHAQPQEFANLRADYRELLQQYQSLPSNRQSFKKPPETWTWDDLEIIARIIQQGERAGGEQNLWGMKYPASAPSGLQQEALAGENRFWGYVWQGAAYEGLTCNALEWQVSQGGGTIVNADRTISVNNQRVVQALERARDWIGRISPDEVTNFTEREARAVWLQGKAAFMRDWPEAYSLSEASAATKGKFGVAILPRDDTKAGRHAAALGGQQLMVSKYSPDKKKLAAIEFVKFLTSEEFQTASLLATSRLPTRSAVYTAASVSTDRRVAAQKQFFASLKHILDEGQAARPSTVTHNLYNDVSTAYFTAVHQVLTNQQDAKTAMQNLEKQLQDLLVFHH
jgi:trehalose/maltose transport system substrate-binding protein